MLANVCRFRLRLRFSRNVAWNHGFDDKFRALFCQLKNLSSQAEDSSEEKEREFQGVNTRLPLFDFQDKYNYVNSHPLRGKESFVNSRKPIVPNVRPPGDIVKEIMLMGESRDWIRALQIAEEIIVRDLRIQPSHWHSILKTCIQDGRGEECERMFRSWLRKHPLDAKRSTNGFASVSLSYATNGDVINCRRIFHERIERLQSKPVSAAEYLVLLEAHSRAGDVDGVDRLMPQICNGFVSSKQEGEFLISEAWRLLLEARFTCGLSPLETLNEMVASGHEVNLSHISPAIKYCIQHNDFSSASQLLADHLSVVGVECRLNDLIEFVCGALEHASSSSIGRMIIKEFFHQLPEFKRLSSSPSSLLLQPIDSLPSKTSTSTSTQLDLIHTNHGISKFLSPVAKYLSSSSSLSSSNSIDSEGAINWTVTLQAGTDEETFKKLIKPVLITYLKGIAHTKHGSRDISECLSRLESIGIDHGQDFEIVLFDSYCSNDLKQAKGLLSRMLSRYSRSGVFPSSWSGMLKSICRCKSSESKTIMTSIAYNMILSKVGMRIGDYNCMMMACNDDDDDDDVKRVIGSMMMDLVQPNIDTYIILARHFNSSKQFSKTCLLLIDLVKQRLSAPCHQLKSLVTELCIGFDKCGMDRKSDFLRRRVELISGSGVGLLIDVHDVVVDDFLLSIHGFFASASAAAAKKGKGRKKQYNNDDDDEMSSGLNILLSPLNLKYFAKYPWGILEKEAYKRENEENTSTEAVTRRRLKLRQPLFSPKSEFGVIIMTQWPTPLHGLILRLKQHQGETDGDGQKAAKSLYSPLPRHTPPHLASEKELELRTRSRLDENVSGGSVEIVRHRDEVKEYATADDDALLDGMPYAFPARIREIAKNRGHVN